MTLIQESRTVLDDALAEADAAVLLCRALGKVDAEANHAFVARDHARTMLLRALWHVLGTIDICYDFTAWRGQA